MPVSVSTVVPLVYILSVSCMGVGLRVLVSRAEKPPELFTWSRALLLCIGTLLVTIGFSGMLTTRNIVKLPRGTSVKEKRQLVRRLLLATFVVCGITVFFNTTGSKRDNLTREISHLTVLTALCALLTTGVLVTELCGVLLEKRSRAVMPLLVIVLLMSSFFTGSRTVSMADEDAVDWLRRDVRATISGGLFEFSCDSERIDPPFASLGYLPRRVINFFTGSESCPGASSTRFSLYAGVEGDGNSRDHGVVVPLRCPSGGLPRIRSHDFTRNFLGSRQKLELVHEWHAQYDDISRNWKANVEAQVAGGSFESVVRDTNGNLEFVEEGPSKFTVEASTLTLVPGFDAFRNAHPNVGFARIPFRSGALSVFCDSEEEYHINMELRKVNRAPSSPSAKGLVNGVMVLMLDAVSRQDFLRLLPLTSRWLRKHTGKKENFTVAEFPGYTTVGMATKKNFVAMIAGHSLEGANESPEWQHVTAWVKQHNWFKRIREMRPKVRTSFLSGHCANLLSAYFNLSSSKCTGFGDEHESMPVDDFMFSPMCHSDYGPFEGNFVGANSIMRRCIGKDYVHDFVFDYLENYVSQQRGPHFMLVHLSEGHENSHAVLNTMDERLLAFLKKLYSVGYLANNALLIASDHGNHMGPYADWSVAGKYERTTPALVGLVPSDAVPDAAALEANKAKLVTPHDVHGTVFDLLGVYPKPPLHTGYCKGSAVRSINDRLPSLLRDLGERNSCAQANAEKHCSKSYMCR